MHPDSTLFGIDRLVLEGIPWIRDLRVGLITNDAAVTASVPRPLTPSRQALLQAGCRVTILFSPEHGISTAAADGEPVGDTTDALTGLPVRSLYGAGLRPSPEVLAGLDGLIFDLPDVGARFYTYIWTLSYVLEACAESRIPLWVLDRPNPLGGELSVSEGPMFEETLSAGLIGRWSIPIRHGLTVGELATLWNAERNIGAELRVVRMLGWEGRPRWPRLGLPFVPTSPAMPSYDTALLYPGTGLLEAINLSEGRGTAVPFRVVGAPWLAGATLAQALRDCHIPGIVARPVEFTPWLGHHAGHWCSGVMLHVTDDQRFRPVALGLHLLSLLWRLHPHECRWAAYPTAANPSGSDHFDFLIGQRNIRPLLEHSPDDLGARISAWTSATDWRPRVHPYLLYDEEEGRNPRR